MADPLSRRAALKFFSIATATTLAGCDRVALPGLAKRTLEEPKLEAGPMPARLPSSQTAFAYEVIHRDEDWRTRLTPAEYSVLREGATEPRNSHYYTRQTEAGIYRCKGCDLPVYDWTQKVILDIGWVFFRHAIPDSLLSGIDGRRIEVHCRRCGSHMGHILYVETEILHCVNGTALNFTPTPP